MKKRRLEEHENQDRWVVSYADFITLLFAFFTTMYAISHVDTGKVKMFQGSMRNAFKTEAQDIAKPVIEGIVPVSPGLIHIEKELKEVVESLEAKEDIEVQRDNRGIVISLGDNLLFEPGKAVIKRDAAIPVEAIITILKKLSNNLIIEGHTDNIPLTNNTLYANNWELSTARATSVLNYILQKYNLPASRFSVAGYAEFRPKKSNATPEGRAKNRRVDIVVLADTQR